MRFLSDEHIPFASVALLRGAGHDVAAVAEGAVGNSDRENIALAIREQRVILTYDRDYGTLVFEQGVPAPPGVVSFRLYSATPEEPAERVLRLLAEPSFSIIGAFVTITRGGERRRSLPGIGSGP